MNDLILPKLVVEVIHAPVALMLSVLVNSMNSAPDVSVPRRKTGTCRRRRADRRVVDESTPWVSLIRSISTFALLVLGT